MYARDPRIVRSSKVTPGDSTTKSGFCVLAFLRTTVASRHPRIVTGEDANSVPAILYVPGTATTSEMPESSAA